MTSSHPQEISNRWLPVAWMPHTSLAPASHVTLAIRSAHACLEDPLFKKYSRPSKTTTSNDGDDSYFISETSRDWKVRISIHGYGGLELVPIDCRTPAAPLAKRTLERNDWFFAPTVARATHDCRWDFVAKLPLRWRDLPRDAYLAFRVVQDSGDVVYEAVMPFFSEYGKLVTGLQKIELKTSPFLEDCNRNLGVYPMGVRAGSRFRLGVDTVPDADRDDDDSGDLDDPVWEACCVLDQLERLEQQARSPAKSELKFGRPQSVPWLDALTKARNEAILQDFLSCREYPIVLDDQERAFLVVELPTFEIPIMHEESFYPTPQQGASGAVSPLDLALFRKEEQRRPSAADSFDPLQLVNFLDYENEHDNPVEDKYRALAHDLIRGLVDPALKPDRGQRDRLAAIVDSTSHHLSREEKDLLWRFRFSLVDNRRALTKFLLAVDWTVDSEVVQAAELLEQWKRRSPIEVTDALKLLGKHVAFQTNLVRSYAIDTLEAAPDSELRLYLLQLVQALKYESEEVMNPTGSRVRQSSTSPGQSTQVSSLATFLIDRASKNMELANFLYWYLKVEHDNPTHGTRYREVFASLETKLSATSFHRPEFSPSDHSPVSSPKTFKSIVGSVSSKIGTSFRTDHGNEKDRSSASGSGSARDHESQTMWQVLVWQDEFITGLLGVQQRCRDVRGKKDQKEEEFRSLLLKEGFRSTANGSIPLPSAPEIYINGINPESAKIFKSALYPALVDFHIDFRVRSSELTQAYLLTSSYKAIVKTGDDLRQDQLVIMMIQLMDGLLKRAALDLCLTPYSILATSPTSGLVAFVEGSIPISQVLSQHNNSILQFFQSCAPQSGAKYDVKPEVLSTYLRSLAGYCVITYLLGVGDRHLDNILLRSTGHFFHIDFGFIFGRDPKPLPPAFRLTREMVDGLGGSDSGEYRQFCSLACQAFNALRKSAGLVLNLLSLMSDAGIEDLSNNPLGDSDAVIAKVEERFRLDLTDEQAERFFIGLVNDCLAALAPRVMDVFHSLSVARR